jgi:tRNA (adenine-N(1)-)-methyltransferase non-catalytic subunit
MRTARANEKKVPLGKLTFSLEGAIGKPYGTTFEVDKSRLVPVQKIWIDRPDSGLLEGMKSGIDNKDIQDDGKAQRLNRDEIEALKEEGASAEEIIEQLVENSATFKERTEYSQAKYIKRKLMRHQPCITVLRPSIRLICEMCWTRNPAKSLYMRVDTLAQILTIANVHSGCNVMLVESCQGLVTGAVLERLGGQGRLIQVTHNKVVVRPALDALNLSDSVHQALVDIQLNELSRQDGVCESAPEVSVKVEDGGIGEVECEGDGEDGNRSGESELLEKSGKKRRRKMTPEEKAAKKKARLEHRDSINKFLAENKMDWYQDKTIAILKYLYLPVSSLIVASKYQPWPIVSSLLKYVAPSRQIIVYCQYKEPLVECYSNMRSEGCVINWKLSETWYRQYQVMI